MAGATYEGRGHRLLGPGHPSRHRRRAAGALARQGRGDAGPGHYGGGDQERLRPDRRGRGPGTCASPGRSLTRRPSSARTWSRPTTRGDRAAYLALVTGPMLEAAAPYARWIDVFCEPHSAHAFTEDEARAVLLAGRAAGRGLRVHGADLQAMLTLPAVPPQLGWRIAIGPRGRRPRHARATGGRRATSPVGQSRRHPHAADQQVHRPAREGRLAVVRLRFAVRGWNASAPAPCGTPQRHWTTSLRATRACRVALVGHSMGGRVALMLARDPRPAIRDPWVRAIVGLAPWIERTDHFPLPSGQQLLILHGLSDRITDPRASRLLVESLRAGAHRLVRRSRPRHARDGSALPCRDELTNGFIEGALVHNATTARTSEQPPSPFVRVQGLSSG